MRKLAAEVIDITNTFGNRQVPNGWPDKDLFERLMRVFHDVDIMESDLRDCVNELCLKCGSYRDEHLGACDGCRWKQVKKEVS